MVSGVTGLQAVLGQPAQALIAEFGAPALDTKEAQARRLQFRSGICVLDAYLYPPEGGGEAKVTYRRNVSHDGNAFRVEIDSRGFQYELTPPVEVNVTKGRILSTRKKPPRNSAPARPWRRSTQISVSTSVTL